MIPVLFPILFRLLYRGLVNTKPAFPNSSLHVSPIYDPVRCKKFIWDSLHKASLHHRRVANESPAYLLSSKCGTITAAPNNSALSGKRLHSILCRIVCNRPQRLNGIAGPATFSICFISVLCNSIVLPAKGFASWTSIHIKRGGS